MVVFISQFEQEVIKTQFRAHTEYLIELRVEFAVPIVNVETDQVQGSEDLGASWTVRRRYTDFLTCHNHLATLALGAVPPLPPKEPVLQKIIGSSKARHEWQDSRLEALKGYVDALLKREDLLELLPVQELLACGPIVRLNRPPSPPTSVRARLLHRGSDEEREKLDRDGVETTDADGYRSLEVIARPAQAPSISAADLLFSDAQLPVKEVVVVFRKGLDDQDIDRPAVADQEVTEIVHMPIKVSDEDVTQLVRLPVGCSYSVMAFSVSVAGVQSTPVMLAVTVPDPKDPLVVDLGSGGQEPTPSSKMDENLPNRARGPASDAAAGVPRLDLQHRMLAHEHKSSADQEGEEADNIGNEDRRSDIDTSGVDAQTACEGMMTSEESGVTVAETPRGGSGGEVASRRRTLVQRKEVRSTGFRGRVAAEYVAVASEKNRQLYERAPHILQRRSRGESEPMLLQMEVAAKSDRNSAKEDLAELERVQQRTHRDSEVLDIERQEAMRAACLSEARVAAAWVAEVLNNEQLAEARNALSYDTLQEALSSGELLCALVNRLAALGGCEQPPISSYHQNPSTKFKSMENVSKFIAACREHFKMPQVQLFGTLALAEGRDMQGVVKCIVALAARVQVVYPNYQGPQMQPSAR